MSNNYDLINKAIENKDVFTTLIIVFLFLVIIMPFMYYIVKKVLDSINKNINDLAIKLKETLETHTKSDEFVQLKIFEKIQDHHISSQRSFLDLQQKLWNTVLNKEQTVSLLQEKMWFVSYWKLEFIKQVMLFNHIHGRREEIKTKIKNELERKSEEYIREFWRWITPIWDLAKWLEKNFWAKEFEEFIEEIIKIVYRETEVYKQMDRTVVVEIKKNDIATLMKDLQSKLAKRLREDLDNDNYVN